MFKKLAIAALLAGLGSIASALPIIDKFDVGQPIAQDFTNGTPSFGATASAGVALSSEIIGGQREIYVNAVDGADGVARGTQGFVSLSSFSFDNGSSVQGFGALRWDGASQTGFDITKQDLGINRTGFAPVDFAAVSDSIKLTVLSSDAAFPFTLQFFSSATAWTSFTFAAIPVCTAGDVSCLSQAGALVGPADFFFNYNIINLLGTKFGGGADFSNITALQAIFNFDVNTLTPGSARAVDFTIDLVEGGRVPEPGSLALAGLALLGLSAVVRRRTR